MEAFPVNKLNSGHVVLLGDHYNRTLKALEYDPKTLPESLFFTFCGDILGSSGAHYEKGKSLNFFEACERASLNFSDDFMESLAMHCLRETEITPDIDALLTLKERFFSLISDHFEALSQTYSPWFGALRNAEAPESFLKIITTHASCGAAMRAAILAADGLSDTQAFHLLLMTHAHTESMEGGFWVKGFTEAALQQKSFAHCLSAGRDKSAWAREQLAVFHGQHNIESQKSDVPPFDSFVQDTLAQNDPYATIEDIATDGIESRFVVGAVAYVLRYIFDNGQPADDIPSLVTKCLEIGGDPDTTCSIAMSLYGARWPKEARRFLNEVGVGRPES